MVLSKASSNLVFHGTKISEDMPWQINPEINTYPESQDFDLTEDRYTRYSLVKVGRTVSFFVQFGVDFYQREYRDVKIIFSNKASKANK